MKDLEKFISGYRNFQDQFFCDENTCFKELQHTQSPKVMAIACSDSRVDPAILTGCEPGDIFMVRNVANLVPPYEQDGALHGVSSALEYAVKNLRVEHIIVFGHSNCGGIKALLQQSGDTSGSEFVGRWVCIADRARKRIQKELGHKPFDIQCRACEMASILLSLENLLTFPWVLDAVESGRTHLHGWYFDMTTGDLLSYKADTKHFEPLVENGKDK